MLTYILIGYIGIGVLLGIKHISRGVYGAKGPIATFVAWAFLWPVFLLLSTPLEDLIQTLSGEEKVSGTF